MEKKQEPAVIYFSIYEEEEKLKRQVLEINKSLQLLAKLKAEVGAGMVSVDETVVKNLIDQYELNDIYRKATQTKIEEDVME